MKEYTQCIICNEDKDERLTYDDASRLPHHDSCIANATVPQRDKAIALISERKKELAKEYFISQDELKKVLSEEVQGKRLYADKDVELSRRVYDKKYREMGPDGRPVPKFSDLSRRESNIAVQGNLIGENNHSNFMKQGSQIPINFGHPLKDLPKHLSDKLQITLIGDEYLIKGDSKETDEMIRNYLLNKSKDSIEDTSFMYLDDNIEIDTISDIVTGNSKKSHIDKSIRPKGARMTTESLELAKKLLSEEQENKKPKITEDIEE